MKRTFYKSIFLIRVFCFTLIAFYTNADNVWECIEESSESPTVCKNQNGKTVMFELGDENFSLKALGKDFTASLSSEAYLGKMQAINNRYFVSFTEEKYATVNIEVDEKLNFIGEEVEYFYDKDSDSDIEYYKGAYALDEDGIVVKDGYGYAKYWNGWIYKGNFKDDVRSGAGEIIYDQEKFVGEFWDDMAINGKYEYENGVIYEGGFLGNDRHGYGEMKLPNGSRYVGAFEYNSTNGLGTLYYENGAIYHGEFMDDLQHGEGVYTYPPGNQIKLFIGTYKNDQVFKGVYIDSKNRPVEIGFYKDNLLHGSGTRYSYKENGELNYILKGAFKNGNCHGSCEEIYGDASSFKGEYEDGERNGMGTLQLTYSRLSGYFDKDGLQGNGTYIDLSQNFKWEGPFVNGKKNGQGVVTFLDNGSKFSATFNEDEYIGLDELSLEALQRNKRVALIIGNDEYLSNPLQFAVKDSQGMADILENAGFEVIHIKNATQEIFLDSLYDFQRKIKQYGKSTDVLFYYAGHASQVRGINYLNPVDTIVNRESQLEIRSININRVFEVLNESIDGVKIAILDACRNNPFASSIRSAKSGLAQMSAPPGTIIAYSTAPGETAIDGSRDGLGIYTGSLVNAISEPGIKIEEVFKETRKKVVSLTGGQQIPWESSSLISDFYFIKEN